MKKLNWKKIFLWFLVLTLIVPCEKAQASQTPEIVVQSANFAPGNEKTINVYFNHLQGLSGIEYTLFYPSDDFEVVSITPGNAISGGSGSINHKELGVIKHSFIQLDGLSGNVLALSIRLKAKTDTPTGNYTLSVSVGEAYDVNFQNISFQKTFGTLVVNNTNPTPTTQIHFSNALNQTTASKGDLIQYTLSSSNTSNLAGGEFSFTYDDELLQLESVSINEKIIRKNTLYSINTSKKGYVEISYIDTEVIPSYTALFYLNFKVIKNVSTSTEIIAQFKDLTDQNFNILTSTNKKVTLSLQENTESEKLPKMWMEWDGNVHDTILVDVLVEGKADIAAGDFVIVYDPEALQPKSVNKGSQLDGSSYLVVNEKMDEGEIRFSYINTHVPKEDIALVQIEFEILPSFHGNTTLTCTSTSCNNSQFKKVTLEYTPLALTITKHVSMCDIQGIKDAILIDQPVQLPIVIMDEWYELTASDYSVSYQNNDQSGKATVTISGKGNYRGSCTYDFQIKQPSSIKVTTLPTKTTYEVNELLDISGGKITIYYDDNSSEELALSEDMLSGFDSSVVGEQTLTVNYHHLTTTFTITIKKTILYGDVNRDGRVNNQDRMILTRCLAEWSGYPMDLMDLEAADVNKDGRINNQDRMILTRYLAEWTGYSQLPY